MTRTSVHQVVLPTLWGYATLTRRSHPALPQGGSTRRVDTVLPPVLSPHELADFHRRLRTRPGALRRPTAKPGERRLREALRTAIDVRTTGVLEHSPQTDLFGLRDLALASLVRAMRTATTLTLAEHEEALARQLAWCGFVAARDGEVGSALDAAAALRQLAAQRADAHSSDHPA